MSALALGCAGARVRVDPARGGRVTSLQIDGFEVLADPAPPSAQVAGWYGGIFPLAPWAGRLPVDGLDAGGLHQVVPPGPARTHGLVHDVPWQVLHTGPRDLLLVCPLPTSWAFRAVVHQRIELQPGRLTLDLAVHADVVQPVSCGFHPWFRREPDGRLPSLDLDTAGRLVPGPHGLVPATELPGGDPHPDRGRPWDDLFAATGPAHLAWPGGPDLALSSDAGWWVVYERDPRAFCVEPWTAPPHEVGTPTGPSAAPGRPHGVRLEIAW